jgi:hypothetical protein
VLLLRCVFYDEGMMLLFMIFIFIFKVNPPTAYNMLRDYVELREGDWVMQNGANSAVRISVFLLAHRTQCGFILTLF